jgi:hypothetical protein
MREIDWMVYEYSWARIVERDELSRRGRISFKSDYAVSMRRVISHFITDPFVWRALVPRSVVLAV